MIVSLSILLAGNHVCNNELLSVVTPARWGRELCWLWPGRKYSYISIPSSSQSPGSPWLRSFNRATRLSASSHDTPCLLRDVTKWYENIFPFVLLLFGILFLVRASHSPMIWLSLRGTSIHICGFSEITSVLPFKALNLEWLVPYFERNYRSIVVVVLRH